MNQLPQTINTLEIARMVDREHKVVLRDIRNIIKQIDESKIALVNYFIESTYKDAKGEERPCFDCSKKGCELYSTRMTGAKGTQFAVAYIERFNQMENHIKQQLDTSNLSPELQMFQGLFQAVANNELETKRIETKVDNIADIVSLNTTDWRKESQHLIRQMAKAQGGYGAYQGIHSEIYQELDRRANSNLSIRLENKRSRMARAGVSQTKINKTNKLDVIGENKRLLEIYLAVVKEFAIKYGVWKDE
ncbi:Rha family transcriptional regulator [Enterococcus avium]|uniref:Rha family transcriptional regulator n=1 Tax=Enterococcus avium TaxID=33945 RepID=UPI00288E0191|nr:Rha family transcriptional regulator [Enterococcus avium]MDT2500304.1 Rha family transcriptional regulator [Enterococcus avium]